MKTFYTIVTMMLAVVAFAAKPPSVVYVNDDGWTGWYGGGNVELSTDPDEIVAHRKGTMLVERVGNGELFVVSPVVLKRGLDFWQPNYRHFKPTDITFVCEFYAVSAAGNQTIEIQTGAGPYYVFIGQWQAYTHNVLWFYDRFFIRAYMNHGDKLYIRNVIFIER